MEKFREVREKVIKAAEWLLVKILHYAGRARTELEAFADFLTRIQTEIWEPRYLKVFHGLSFVPYVGWLAPLYLKREEPVCQDMGKQGLLLAAVFAASALGLSLLNIFTPREWEVVRIILVILVYLINLFYLGLCAWGIYAAYREKVFTVPYVDRYVRALEL